MKNYINQKFLFERKKINRKMGSSPIFKLFNQFGTIDNLFSLLLMVHIYLKANSEKIMFIIIEPGLTLLFITKGIRGTSDKINYTNKQTQIFVTIFIHSSHCKNIVKKVNFSY